MWARRAISRFRDSRQERGNGVRRLAVVVLLMAATLAPLRLSGLSGYAQSGATLQGDDFNSDVFAAPFHPHCGALAPSCPDPQGSTSWNLNGDRPGYLRIWTQFGSLLGGPADSSNNARNLILQPFNPGLDWTITTRLAFPGTAANAAQLGQTAGLIVYQ